MEEEIWKPVKGYEGLYEISSLGRVKSLSRSVLKKNNRIINLKEKILKPSINSRGYYCLILRKNFTPKSHTVHQLVASSFLNHIPNGYKNVVNHINFNRVDNRLINLEVITSRENTNKKHLKSSSKHTGVYYRKKDRKWQSQININGEVIYLGLYSEELKAKKAYEKALNQHLKGCKVTNNNTTKKAKHSNIYFHDRLNKWESRIRVNGKIIYLGVFSAQEDAYNAQQKKLKELEL